MEAVKNHPMLRVGHTRLVVAGAIVLGLIMGGGLTALLFMARDSSFRTCIVREIREQSPVIMPNVLRLCAERHGVPLPDRPNSN